MKNLSQYFFLVLILIFSLQSFTKADDISEFEIEGMSIGDSLLDFFSVSEIENFNNYDHLPSDMKFRIAEFYSPGDMQMENYEGMQVYYKPNDKKLIIFGLNGNLFCKTIINCKNTYNTIKNDISKIYNTSNNITTNTLKHPDDESGKSTYTYWSVKINGGDISVSHTDWSNQVTWSDNVSVEISSNEVSNWMSNNFGLGN